MNLTHRQWLKSLWLNFMIRSINGVQIPMIVIKFNMMHLLCLYVLKVAYSFKLKVGDNVIVEKPKVFEKSTQSRS